MTITPFLDAIKKDRTPMDDDTLIAAILIGLAWLYASGSAGDAVQGLLSSFLPGDSAPPINVPPSDPGPQPQPAPQPQPVPQPASQPPTSGGGTAGDMIDLSACEFCAGLPEAIKSWPATVPLSIVSLSPAITPSFPLPDSWPDIFPPGFEGTIAYTVCAGAFLGGRWVMGGFIEMWRGRPDCGNNDAGNPEMQLAQNWWYYAAPLAGYLPSPGEQIAFMVVPGDARRGVGPFPVAERSSVVLVTMP